jgi:hypothetical protein
MLSYCDNRDEMEKLAGSPTPHVSYAKTPTSDPLDMQMPSRDPLDMQATLN